MQLIFLGLCNLHFFTGAKGTNPDKSTGSDKGPAPCVNQTPLLCPTSPWSAKLKMYRHMREWREGWLAASMGSLNGICGKGGLRGVHETAALVGPWAPQPNPIKLWIGTQ